MAFVVGLNQMMGTTEVASIFGWRTKERASRDCGTVVLKAWIGSSYRKGVHSLFCEIPIVSTAAPFQTLQIESTLELRLCTEPMASTTTLGVCRWIACVGISDATTQQQEP
mmetsp:Transcript_3726/g.5079  ORF Transcript_3726/g.5079 Transcript_3726/m.5079 type:complete len:111 (-) Transcript_3726:54-386(-)